MSAAPASSALHPIAPASRILFIFTSASRTLTGSQTGYYLSEAAHPYYVLSPHYEIDFAAPQGADPPLDEGSVKAALEDEISVRFLNDETVKSKLATALPLAAVDPSKYAAVFYPGGHGPVLDLPENALSIEIASSIYTAGGAVGAVCHGPAALVNVKDQTGKNILQGRTVTGFSNAEEEMVGKVQDVPFLLEDTLRARGGKYVKAEEPWAARVVVDGNVYTGQNPASAGPLAEYILKALKGESVKA